MGYRIKLMLAAMPLIAACGQSTQESETTQPLNPAAEIQQSLTGLEGGELPPLPTHWIHAGDIGNGQGPVTSADLAAGTADPKQWLLYGGDYANTRHSPIKELNPEAVRDMRVAWAFATGTDGQFEVSPVIYDGIMYVTASHNRLFALDPTSGELFWRYDHQQPDDLKICCGPVNRGVGITGDLVLMATLDARLLAFNRKTGELVWNVELAPYVDGFSATSAPLIVNDMAIIGIAGGEFGVRGFFDAYDVGTGERLWRHYTVPAEGEFGVDTWAGDSYKSGGAPAWTSGAYDPETDTLFWTTGNPSPDWNGDLRAGDNLFSNTLLAIDPSTGERKWHFQFTPHDVWDYDGNTQIFLVDVTRDGETIKAIVQPNRNGYFYIINRNTGEFIAASPYVEEVNWATIDDNGRPVVNPDAYPVEEPTFRVCPSNLGGMNGAWTGAFNPDLGLAYIPVVEACQLFQKGIVAFVKGQPFMGGTPLTLDIDEGRAHGHLSAVDVNTGEVRWRYMDVHSMMGGALSTAGGVVFTGNQSGYALALDGASGEVLWKFKMGGGVRSQPVAYQIDGRTFVAIGSGNWNTLAAFSGGPDDIPEGGHLFVFELPRG
jgi:alcohol dehydrogenase (cytochrome c)